MSETRDDPAPAAAPTAGRLLREARERQGLHIAALAAAIKVAPKKLELLESDRYGELPDATFTRALAQTVCRALKTDSAPVMQLLPPPTGHRLEQVGEGLNTPFRERPGALVQRDWSQVATNPMFWIVGLVLVAAAVVYLLPNSVTALATTRTRPAAPPAAHPAVEPGMPPDAADAASSSAAPSEPVSPGSEGASNATASPSPGQAAASASPPLALARSIDSTPGAASAPAAVRAGELPAGILQFRSTAPSWVEVTDGNGKPVIARLLHAGEAIGVDGAVPLKVRIGNAAGTQVVFRDQPMELKAYTRDNVARLELK